MVLSAKDGGRGASRTLLRHVRTRSSNGEVEQRPVVELPVTIAGLTVLAHCTLTDRSAMRFPALIGRDLIAGRFLVDPTLKNQHPRPRPTRTTSGDHA